MNTVSIFFLIFFFLLSCFSLMGQQIKAPDWTTHSITTFLGVEGNNPALTQLVIQTHYDMINRRFDPLNRPSETTLWSLSTYSAVFGSFHAFEICELLKKGDQNGIYKYQLSQDITNQEKKLANYLLDIIFRSII